MTRQQTPPPIKEIIEAFQSEYHYKILYITKYGSKLFGTDNPQSDTDYKGIFVPTKRDVLLKRDLEHYTYSSGESHSKNSKEDIDLQLYSLYKWFHLLKKGETGAIDLLFSLFRYDTQIFSDAHFATIMRENYTKFYNRHLHSFVGYCVGQSKRYNVRGKRFGELERLVVYLEGVEGKRHGLKIEALFDELKLLFEAEEFEYISIIMGRVSRMSDPYVEGTYLEVLGKKFRSSVSVGYFLERMVQMKREFGNRARASAKGVDWKALSHAMRVIDEVEELLDEGFITFPLPHRHAIKSIKEGKESLDVVMDRLDIKLDRVRKKLAKSQLPTHSDEPFMEALILDWLV
jgi:hypothetical protein